MLNTYTLFYKPDQASSSVVVTELQVNHVVPSLLNWTFSLGGSISEFWKSKLERFRLKMRHYLAHLCNFRSLFRNSFRWCWQLVSQCYRMRPKNIKKVITYNLYGIRLSTVWSTRGENHFDPFGIVWSVSIHGEVELSKPTFSQFSKWIKMIEFLCTKNFFKMDQNLQVLIQKDFILTWNILWSQII